ncbi:pyridoxamine 5'-phosphate oxidase (plasmid) [Legionella adelaidensis]|uniref:Pyridoxamine 5'-phosphate oxidase n=1 Tax=Legionella adelaidensis TaxID=45056 RepID=A0A0W0R3S6_9GAMM|nr:pyridoxamine 5'-phosphate oxidase family protein [Legionella adelaidensis]KTC65699.1 pyridoxamine 5'-phosphate oxidase [Legionella adelaidensis]VEH85981.1 pyridoxamine 5'-phosphate oxidase [Legionella adelaidensis]
MHPIELLKTWLEEEKSANIPYAQHAVLSSQGINGQAHGRVVAIREIKEDKLLFFTQKRTRKVEEIKKNPAVTLTFWFELSGREVIVEGEAMFLSETQNRDYWKTYPKLAQIRFCSYAPTSGLPIENKQLLEDKRLQIAEHNQQEQSLPLSKDYCGISVKPLRFVFYDYRLDELSDVWEYQIEGSEFVRRLLSP